MSQPLHVQIIRSARALLADESKWCGGEMAFDNHAVPICATNPKASRWCAYGALVAATYTMTHDREQAFDLADAVASSLFGGCDALMRVNDTRGHAAVLTLFDEVITHLS
jgi:hypothetical protein